MKQEITIPKNTLRILNISDPIDKKISAQNITNIYFYYEKIAVRNLHQDFREENCAVFKIKSKNPKNSIVIFLTDKKAIKNFRRELREKTNIKF